jgi:hypothetical protein
MGFCRGGVVSCGLLALSLGACDVQRPAGSYSPLGAPDAQVHRVEPPEELDNDELPALSAGGDGGTSEQEDGGEVEAELQSLRHRISGDYWLRMDLYTSAESNGITVNSHTTSFSLARVGVDEADAFKMIDWQCLVSTEQTCEEPCLSAAARIATGEGRAYRPAVRTLRVDPETGKWSASLVPFALGWKGNFVDEPDALLPEDERDERVYDIAGDGEGVNVDVKIVTGASTTECDARVVQKLSFAYSGFLEEAQFTRGEVTEKGSEQVVLGGSCPPNVRGQKTLPYTLRMVRVPEQHSIDEQWTCPSESEFRAVLKTP